MTTIEAVKLVNSLKPNNLLPPVKRNKSWLFIYGESTGELHFYDVKFNPEEGMSRINAAHIVKKRVVELLDVLAYQDAGGAEIEAKSLRTAQDNLKYYRTLAIESASAAAGAAAPAA